jgi:beta-lactam-binding protein with PASTA domain
MTYHYLLENGSGAYLLEDAVTYYELDYGPAANMPNLVGLDYYAAQLLLQQAGILVLSSAAWSAFPVSAKFQKSPFAPGTVLAQYPSVNMYVAVNAPITLTLSEFPVGVAFP